MHLAMGTKLLTWNFFEFKRWVCKEYWQNFWR